MSYFYNLFTRLLCDNSNSLTYEPRKGAKSNTFTCQLCDCKQGYFLEEHARPLNKLCVWRFTTGSAFIKMARLKAIVAIIFLVGLGECARDLTKCVVSKNTVTWSYQKRSRPALTYASYHQISPPHLTWTTLRV